MKVNIYFDEPWEGRKGEYHIDLEAVCDTDGETYLDEDMKKKKTYPIPKVRKLFTMILNHMDCCDRTPDEIQEYLESHSKSYAKEFAQIRKKEGW